MALFGLFGAFVAFVMAELAGSSQTRGATRAAFVLVLLTAGGLGPAAWLFGLSEVVETVATVIL